MHSGEIFETEGLERIQSPGKGRGLRARRRFAVGELLFSCPAFTCVLTVNERGNHCECCFARYRPAAGRPACLALLGKGREAGRPSEGGFGAAAAGLIPSGS